MAKAIAGQVVKQNLYISIHHNGELSINDYDPSSDNFTYPRPVLGTFEVEVTIPEFNETELKVKMLENQLAKMNAEHHIKTQNIKDQIQRLLAIGHDSHDGEVV